MIEHPMLCSIVAWISGTRKTIHTLGQFQSIFNRYAVNFFTSNVMMFHVNIDYQINTFIFYFLFFLSAKNGINLKGIQRGIPTHLHIPNYTKQDNRNHPLRRNLPGSMLKN